MGVPFNEASIPGRHTIRYRVRDDHKNNPVREVEVLATREEIETLVRDGYLVRERLIPNGCVERLRAALADLRHQARERPHPPAPPAPRRRRRNQGTAGRRWVYVKGFSSTNEHE